MDSPHLLPIFPKFNSQLLLQAALWEPPQSVAVYQQWRTGNDFEALDGRSFALLSVLYRNLQRLENLNDPILPRLKGIYKRSWYQNQLRLPIYSSAIQALSQKALPILLDESALLSDYDDLGSRTLERVSIGLASSAYSEAWQLLAAQGWQSKIAYHRYSEPCTRFYRSITANTHCCLQIVQVTDQQRWQRAGVAPFAELSLPRLDPSTQLVRLCQQGLAWREPEPSLLWWVDAYTLLQRHAVALDWSYLYQQPPLLRLALCDGLSYLVDVLQAPVAAAHLAQLRSITVTPAQQLAYQRWTSPHPVWRGLLARYVEYQQLQTQPPSGLGWYGFLHYIRSQRELPSIPMLLRQLVQRAATHVSKNTKDHC